MEFNNFPNLVWLAILILLASVAARARYTGHDDCAALVAKILGLYLVGSLTLLFLP